MKLHGWMLVLALFLGNWLGLLPAQAQTKIAVIDFQTALLNTEDMKKESAELEARYQGRQDEIATISSELEEIQSKLQSAQGAEAARLQTDGQRKQRTAQRLSEDLQSDVEFDRQNILASASARMRDIIRDLRMEKQLDMIVDAGGVLAHNALIDLTAEATQAYNAKHPAP